MNCRWRRKRRNCRRSPCLSAPSRSSGGLRSSIHSQMSERMPSTVARLQSSLHSLTERAANFIRDMPVEYFERNGGSVVFVCPEYHWGQASPEQLNAQLALKRDYEQWFEIFRSAFRTATNDLNQRIKEADQAFRCWIELSEDWSISPDRAANEKRLREDAERFVKIFAILEVDGAIEPILIPDTNAIVGEPDPTQYKDIAGDDGFTFLLLPTVLAELDTMKTSHRNQDFREKVKRAITRIKGWRNQGPLLDGVTVSRTITVRAVAIEPDMQHTLSWLDEHNRDDRIIATVLEVQSAYPAARVVLVTGDVNLLNKADVAKIKNAELGLS